MSEQTPQTDAEAEEAPHAERRAGGDAMNLIMADLAMRAGTTLLRKGVERGFLGGKPLSKAERELAESKARGKGFAKKAGKLAATSAPVAGAVAAGLLVKNLFDRSQRVRARRYGQIEDASGGSAKAKKDKA